MSGSLGTLPGILASGLGVNADLIGNGSRGEISATFAKNVETRTRNREHALRTAVGVIHLAHGSITLSNECTSTGSAAISGLFIG
jgi:hypothetical protein